MPWMLLDGPDTLYYNKRILMFGEPVFNASLRLLMTKKSTNSDGGYLTWQEVNAVHKVRNGIYERNGQLVSLLTDFGKINPCYQDKHGSSTDVIVYTGNGRRGDQKLDRQNQALLDAIVIGHPVPLFNKLGAGKWVHMGSWRVADGSYVFEKSQRRMVWKFTLIKA